MFDESMRLTAPSSSTIIDCSRRAVLIREPMCAAGAEDVLAMAPEHPCRRAAPVLTQDSRSSQFPADGTPSDSYASAVAAVIGDLGYGMPVEEAVLNSWRAVDNYINATTRASGMRRFPCPHVVLKAGTTKPDTVGRSQGVGLRVSHFRRA